MRRLYLLAALFVLLLPAFAYAQAISVNGQAFTPHGIGEEWSGRQSAQALTSGPLAGTNYVRLGFWDPNEAPVSDVVSYVQSLTAAGKVVNIQDFHYPDVLTGIDLANAASWYHSLASALAGDKNVLFSTQNEPCCDQMDVSNEINTIVNAIRSAGNTNTILMTPTGGTSTNGLNVPGSGVAWDLHYYNWLAQYSSDLGANESALANEISAAKSTANIPVVIDEFGNSTNGANTDPGGAEAVQAVLVSGYGSAAWGLCGCGQGSDILLNGDGTLSDFGQMVAQSMTGAQLSSIGLNITSGPAIPSDQGNLASTAASSACSRIATGNAATPGNGSFTADGSTYSVDASHGDVAAVNGAPINNGAYETSQLAQGSDGNIYGQDEHSGQWFLLAGSGSATWWVPLDIQPPVLLSAAATAAACASALQGVGQQNQASGTMPDILQICADPATIANATNADLCAQAYQSQAQLDQVLAKLAAAQQGAASAQSAAATAATTTPSEDIQPTASAGVQ